MGDKQVVIVKEAQDMKEWKSRKKEDDDEVATHQEFEKLYETVTQSKIK